MKHVIILIILISALPSCDTVTISNDRLLSLYRLRIPDSKYVIYEFSIAGHMAFDGANQGYAILDSSQIFSGDKIEEIDAYHIQGRLSLDSLKMLSVYSPGDRILTERDTLTTPIKQYFKTYNGIPVQVLEYQRTYGVPAGIIHFNQYNFDNCKETKDSVFFYGIEKKHEVSYDLPRSKGFIKGNIKIIDSSKENIGHIEIQEFIVTRGDVYKFGGRDSVLSNRPIVDIIQYNFYPKRLTSSSTISDIGVFKRLK